MTAELPAPEARRGLSTAEAARLLAVHGPNEPVPGRRLTGVAQFLRLFANPLVLILLAASGLSAALGRGADAAIITTMVLLGVSIGFWQTYRAERAADRLRASVTPTATVLRDGAWQEIAVRAVVPGDLLRLSAGDLVPADARLIESRDLSALQSMLTGESLPCDKHASAEGGEGPDAPNLVFLGTSVVSGTATALVLRTGAATLFGDIAARLATRAPETEFEHGLRHFSLLILRTTVALVLFILLVGILLRRDPLESLLFAVALGVGLTPEFLPMIVSVALTKGAIRMAREHVIVRRLPAIQNLGSIDVLCSDKTGTLTSGNMRIDRVVDAGGGGADRPFDLAHVNSLFQTGIKGALDVAILARTAADAGAYTKVDEIPFDFERRRLSVVVEAPGAEGGRRLLVTKGAPEAILDQAVAAEIGGRVTPLDDPARGRCEAVHRALGAEGLRVIAVAYRWVDSRAAYSRDDETELVIAGFIGFADPVLPDIRHVLATLKADGVTVKILTGDSDLVARHVCRQVGLDDSLIVTGDDLSRVDDAALGHLAEQAMVFARVSPAQKNRVILALKRRGHVVGFLGDGINDAPSLHTADVGISVKSAADVARDAADIVLGRTSLRALHHGIIEGRRASGNMMKYLLMGTSSNFGNMFSMAAASLFLPFLPMLPTQILLNNFLYDLAQVTIPTDTVDRQYLSRPQRWDMRLIRDFMVFVGPVSSLFDFLTFFVLLRIFHASASLFHTGWFVESLATQTLVLFVIRTLGSPFATPPSRALATTTLAVVAAGAALPFTPLAAPLGFTPLPASFFLFLAATLVTYLAAVELVKRRLVGARGAAWRRVRRATV